MALELGLDPENEEKGRDSSEWVTAGVHAGLVECGWSERLLFPAVLLSCGEVRLLLCGLQG